MFKVCVPSEIWSGMSATKGYESPWSRFQVISLFQLPLPIDTKNSDDGLPEELPVSLPAKVVAVVAVVVVGHMVAAVAQVPSGHSIMPPQ